MEEYIIKHNQEIWIKIYKILNVLMLGGLPNFAKLKECETPLLEERERGSVCWMKRYPRPTPHHITSALRFVCACMARHGKRMHVEQVRVCGTRVCVAFAWYISCLLPSCHRMLPLCIVM